MTLQETIDNLEFEPIAQWFNRGNEYQKCMTTYKGIPVIWNTIFPHNWMKEPTDWFLVDLIVPDNTILKDGEVNTRLYTEEGFGYPQFETLEASITYIDLIRP